MVFFLALFSKQQQQNKKCFKFKLMPLWIINFTTPHTRPVQYDQILIFGFGTRFNVFSPPHPSFLFLFTIMRACISVILWENLQLNRNQHPISSTIKADATEDDMYYSSIVPIFRFVPEECQWIQSMTETESEREKKWRVSFLISHLQNKIFVFSSFNYKIMLENYKWEQFIKWAYTHTLTHSQHICTNFFLYSLLRKKPYKIAWIVQILKKKKQTTRYFHWFHFTVKWTLGRPVIFFDINKMTFI